MSAEWSMHLPEQKKQEIQKIEFSLGKEEDMKRLEQWLVPLIGEEQAGQCVFVLKSLAEKDFGNHCNDATQEFGNALKTKFGGEESFFDLVPDAQYYDVRSYAPLGNVGYQRGDFHSVGLIALEDGNKKPSSLVVDITHGVVTSGKKQELSMVQYVPGGRSLALEALRKTYGGSWEVDYTLNKDTGKFLFNTGK